MLSSEMLGRKYENIHPEHTVPFSSMCHHAGRQVGTSSFKVGDKVIHSDQHGVEERGVILSVNQDDGGGGYGYGFKADGWVRAVDASDLVLDEAVSVGVEDSLSVCRTARVGDACAERLRTPSLILSRYHHCGLHARWERGEVCV